MEGSEKSDANLQGGSSPSRHRCIHGAPKRANVYSAPSKPNKIKRICCIWIKPKWSVTGRRLLGLLAESILQALKERIQGFFHLRVGLVCLLLNLLLLFLLLPLPLMQLLPWIPQIPPRITAKLLATDYFDPYKPSFQFWRYFSVTALSQNDTGVSVRGPPNRWCFPLGVPSKPSRTGYQLKKTHPYKWTSQWHSNVRTRHDAFSKRMRQKQATASAAPGTPLSSASPAKLPKLEGWCCFC